MNPKPLPPEPMTPDDALWAAKLMERRRVEYEQYSPAFWRPADDAIDGHAEFLAAQISDAEVIALRTPTGFAIATRNDAHFYVDDFTVERGGWDTTGALILHAVQSEATQRGAEFVRVVTAKLDKPKVALIRSNEFQLAEQWWVREPSAMRGASVSVSEDYEIHETEAPPVFDPGGPVGILTSFTEDALEAAVHEAAMRYLSVLIAPTPAGDDREAALDENGFAVASQFYVSGAAS